jgi:hypothetical protein
LLELKFIVLCDSFNEDGKFLPPLNANYRGSNVPLVFWAFIFQCVSRLEKTMFNVIDCIKTMFFTQNKLDKMMTLNYNIVNIHNINVCCLSVNFNSDVLLNYHPCVNQHGILVKCREWIKCTTTTFGARWKQPTLQMILHWVFKVDALPSPKLGPRWASVFKTTELWGLEGTLPALITKGVEGRAEAPRWD